MKELPLYFLLSMVLMVLWVGIISIFYVYLYLIIYSYDYFGLFGASVLMGTMYFIYVLIKMWRSDD